MTDRTVRTLVTGRGLVEAPRWHDGRLHFSDWSAGEVLTLTPEGGTQVIASADAFPLCTDRLPDGRLLLVAGTQLLVQAADGLAPEPYADLAPAGDQVWNDIVVDGRGNAYVNGGGGFEGGDNAVALVTPDGVVRQVAQELAFPNGMAVTPDGGTLLVADSYGQEIVAFGIAPDGGLSGRRTWAAVPEHPDGICLDAEGAVWFADVGTSRCVRVAEGGRLLDEVPLDRGCFACVLGGPDRTTLYITAAEWLGWEEGVTAGSGILAAVDVGVSGAGYP